MSEDQTPLFETDLINNRKGFTFVHSPNYGYLNNDWIGVFVTRTTATPARMTSCLLVTPISKVKHSNVWSSFFVNFQKKFLFAFQRTASIVIEFRQKAIRSNLSANIQMATTNDQSLLKTGYSDKSETGDGSSFDRNNSQIANQEHAGNLHSKRFLRMVHTLFSNNKNSR